MATQRINPTRNHGSLPELDDHITKTGHANPDFRWEANHTNFRNLTLARLAVADTMGLTDKYPNASAIASHVSVKTSEGFKKKQGHKRIQRKVRAIKPTKEATTMKRAYTRRVKPNAPELIATTNAAPKPRMTKARLAAMDPFNMRERTFIRIGGMEASFSPAADQKHIHTTLAAMNKLAKKQ